MSDNDDMNIDEGVYLFSFIYPFHIQSHHLQGAVLCAVEGEVSGAQLVGI